MYFSSYSKIQTIPFQIADKFQVCNNNFAKPRTHVDIASLSLFYKSDKDSFEIVMHVP